MKNCIPRILIALGMALLVPHATEAQENLAPQHYSYLQKNFFWGITFTALYDFCYSPPSYNELAVNGLPGQSDYNIWGVASTAFDLRLNILNISERASLSVNLPVTPSLGFGEAGFGSVFLPVLMQFNFGYHSTYNNIDHNGFFIGGGYSEVFFPFILSKEGPYEHRHWGDVVVKAGFKTDSRKVKNIEATVGLKNGFSFRLGLGIVLNY